jgi:hypothetical protein
MDNRSYERATEHNAELEQARKDIRSAFYAGLFVSGINLFLLLALIANPTLSQKMGGGYVFIDTAIYCGLTYGIYRKNSACAISMMVYFSIAKLLQLLTGTLPIISIPLAGFLLRCFFQGMVGTSAYRSVTTVYPPIGRIHDPDPAVSRMSNIPSPTDSAEKFWVADRLVELCNGDRSQAEWLLHQLRRKHPGQSMDWYNDRAIEEMSSTTVG